MQTQLCCNVRGKGEDFYPCCPFTFDPPNDDIDVIFGLIIAGNYSVDVRVLVQPFYTPRSATNKKKPINLVHNAQIKVARNSGKSKKFVETTTLVLKSTNKKKNEKGLQSSYIHVYAIKMVHDLSCHNK